MIALKRYGYLLAFVVPGLLPLSWWLGQQYGQPQLWAWFPVLFLYVIVPALDHLIGEDRVNPQPHEEVALEAQRWYQVLTLACVPLCLGLLWWASSVFVSSPMGWFGKLGWIWSVGLVGGVLAINVAHELIHKAGRLEPAAGGILLASVGYGGFKIEHLRGHHVHVATAADWSSAPAGLDVYRFVARAIPHNIKLAFQLEANRLARLGLPAWHWRNELLGWASLTLGMATILGLVFGPAAVGLFFGQALVAICSLEIINYIEHYGLTRQIGADGRPERVNHRHSWNSSFLLTNLLLFQLQRHSDHHAHARRRYQVLRHFDDSPQLPSGYAGMFVLALCPPLWFRVMDRRLPRQ